MNFMFILKKEVRFLNMYLLCLLAYPYYPTNEPQFDNADQIRLDEFLKNAKKLSLNDTLKMDKPSF